mmetsp:Transcript_13090/g.17117  ORF Transcript_13090/g.17117 Transcript_13090/m.17117 type:complete len:295 (+) Transcript_13090:79-963(+)
MEQPYFFEELIAGTVGGALGAAVVHPIDTIKTRTQTSSSGRPAFQILSGMMKIEGVLSPYRGLLAPISGQGLLFAICFAANGSAKKYFQEQNGGAPLSSGQLFLAGSFAGLANSTPRQVFERVKVVMQNSAKPCGAPLYPWSGACFMGILKTEGLSGLLRGNMATHYREIPQFAVYYPVYEYTKAQLVDHYSTSMSETVIHLIAGGAAGISCWLPPFYCIDVIKTRLQSAPLGKYLNTWDCVIKTYSSGGFPAFFNGIGLTMCRAFTLHACIFVGYEATMDVLKNQRQQLHSRA